MLSDRPYGPRYLIQIRWIPNVKLYAARSSRHPDLLVYGASRFLAEDKIKAAIAALESGESK